MGEEAFEETRLKLSQAPKRGTKGGRVARHQARVLAIGQLQPW